ncbi:MAG: 3-dehydroquinate synthase [Oscillospiraceae bacterium]|nr:3-dehydroquinate synthase [Oscillospiraceae bacterium]
MNTITVNASGKYDVIVGRGLIGQCAEYISKAVKSKSFAVVTDDNVDKLYGDIVVSSLENAGFRVCKFVFPHGETSKCTETLNDIYMFLCENHITRSDCLIALGGGVTGDMTGYAAATYLRGTSFIQIPTSLLAQVDSSVGGKTAIDLPCGKNLVGAFKQPELVLCDIDALSTLPREFFIDGMGEVVKYGMIKSAELFEILEKNDLDSIKDILEDIVCRCVSIKRDVVEADEFDRGERMLLNFGHTLGHSIEQYYNYTGISHGCAVAAGMAIITGLAVNRGMCSEEALKRLKSCLAKYELPEKAGPAVSELGNACLNDKKRDGGFISPVICSEVGSSAYVKMTIDEFLDFIG